MVVPQSPMPVPEAPPGLAGVARRHPIPFFLVVAYLWSWAWWLTLRGWLGPAPTEVTGARWVVMVVVGAAGPTISALVTATLRGELAELLGRLLRWRAPAVWYLAALLVPMMYFVGGAWLYSLTGGNVGTARLPAPGALGMSVIAALPFGPLCEELGWRGFLLPRLETRYHPVASSLMLGTAWWLWHAPLMWMTSGTLISGAPVTPWSLLLYLAATNGMALLFTLIANRSNHSLPLAILTHASINSGAVMLFFPSLPAGSVRPASYWAVVVIGVVALIAAVALRSPPASDRPAG